jgi:hypothetical protein
MDWIMVLKGFASLTTIMAAVLVAANISPKGMVAGFSIFVASSLAWIAAGWLDPQPSLYIQNAVLLLVNLAGILRWLPRAQTTGGTA